MTNATVAQIIHMPRRFMGDPRNPVVRDPYADMSPDEKWQRCMDIDAIGYLVERYGYPVVQGWFAMPHREHPLRTLIDRYDIDTIGRWLRYHAWRVGQEGK